MSRMHESAILVGILVTSVVGCGSTRDDLGLGCFFDGGIQDAGPESDAAVVPDAPEEIDAGACDGSACACEPNTKTCKDGDPGAEFVCEQGDAGPTLVRHACDPLSFCAEGSCRPCASSLGECKLGERKCSADTQRVMVCGCLGWQTALECASAGMVACVMPSSPPLPSAPSSYFCVNECGGRDIPLEHMLCDPDPSATCGYLVCDPNTFQLIPEHTACLPAGVSCSKNSDCKSCSCIGGTCIGNTEKSCDPMCP